MCHDCSGNEDIYQFKTSVDNSLLKEEQKKTINEIYMEAYERMIAAYSKIRNKGVNHF
jgi:hypothetical protein